MTKPKGWINESHRHALASRGIPSSKIDFVTHPEMSKIAAGVEYRIIPIGNKWRWTVFRGGDSIYDEGMADTLVEAQTLVSHHIEDYLEELEET